MNVSVLTDRAARVPPPCTEHGLPEPSVLSDTQLARIGKGLAHPARVAILRQFASGRPRVTGEIAAETGLAQSTVSEHLRFLRAAELLSARRDGPRVWYCLRRQVILGLVDALRQLAESPDE